jgi:hypothetical protein
MTRAALKKGRLFYRHAYKNRRSRERFGTAFDKRGKRKKKLTEGNSGYSMVSMAYQRAPLNASF